MLFINLMTNNDNLVSSQLRDILVKTLSCPLAVNVGVVLGERG